MECKAFVLPHGAQEHWERAVWLVARHHTFLQAWALSQRSRRWGVRPKMHYAARLALQSRVANPRMAWTYMDEDCMSLVKAVAEACTPGTAAQNVVFKICHKYARGMDLRQALC